MKNFVCPTLVGTPRCGVHGQRSALSLPMLFLFFSAVSCFAADPLVLGSKKFTESYVLGEIAKGALNDSGIAAEHRQGMGGTIILWEALRGAQIDAYPEYTGTIAQQILKTDRRLSVQEIRDSLAKSPSLSGLTTLIRWSCGAMNRNGSLCTRSAICKNIRN